MKYTCEDGSPSLRSAGQASLDQNYHFWAMMPEYPYLDDLAARAADCIELASIDHMGGADNAVRRVKMLDTRLSLWEPQDKEGQAQFEIDVELGVLFQILSQTAVAEKEGQPIVVIPRAMHAVYVEGVGMTFPNISRYLRLFDISVKDVPVDKAQDICGSAPPQFKAINSKRDGWGDLEPAYRHPWKRNEFNAKNSVDAFRKLAADCHRDVDEGSTDPYTIAMAQFHGHVELAEPLRQKDMEIAISHALTGIYDSKREIVIDKNSWMNKIHRTVGRKSTVKAHSIWWDTLWTSWHDCVKCGEAALPGHECRCNACKKLLYGKPNERCTCRNSDYPSITRMNLNRTRDWDECAERAEYHFENYALGYTWNGKYKSISECKPINGGYQVKYSTAPSPEKVVVDTRRRLVVTALLSDFNKDKNGRMLGYGNVPMIVQQLDTEFVNRVFIELHSMAGSDMPEALFGGLLPDIPVSDFVSRNGYTYSRLSEDTVDLSSPAFSIHVDSDCGDNVTRWYLRYPDGHFHHVGRTADKFEAVHKALIRAEKDRITVDSVTFTDESVAKYFHAQLDTIAKPVATGDVLRISAVTKLDTPVKSDVPVEIEDNKDDPLPTGGSSPTPSDDKKLSQVILGAFREADSYPGRRFSIALSQPKGHDYQQLTFLAPTAEMLKEWNAKHDIVRYTHRYNALLTANKAQVLEWIKGLQGDEVLLCWESYIKTNSERERHFCHRLILGRLIAKHRPDLTVVVDELRCSSCSELYTGVSKIKLTRTADGYQFLCGDCADNQPTTPSQGTGELVDVRIHTDGGSRKGHGGCGIVLVAKNHRREISHYIGEGVTNQAAELHAAITGLKALKAQEKCNVRLITDSEYVIGWATGKYTKLDGSPNKDLIVELKALVAKCANFNTTWVKGHAKDANNNRCDELATQAIEKGQVLSLTTDTPVQDRVEIPVSSIPKKDILPDDGGVSMLRAAREIEKKKTQTNSAWNPKCSLCNETIPGGIATTKCSDNTYDGFHKIDTADPSIQGIRCHICGVVHDDTMYTASGEYYCDTCLCNGVIPHRRQNKE